MVSPTPMHGITVIPVPSISSYWPKSPCHPSLNWIYLETLMGMTLLSLVLLRFWWISCLSVTNQGAWLGWGVLWKAAVHRSFKPSRTWIRRDAKPAEAHRMIKLMTFLYKGKGQERNLAGGCGICITRHWIVWKGRQQRACVCVSLHSSCRCACGSSSISPRE